jgi:hypothetical protein
MEHALHPAEKFLYGSKFLFFADAKSSSALKAQAALNAIAANEARLWYTSYILWTWVELRAQIAAALLIGSALGIKPTEAKIPGSDIESFLKGVGKSFFGALTLGGKS